MGGRHRTGGTAFLKYFQKKYFNGRFRVLKNFLLIKIFQISESSRQTTSTEKKRYQHSNSLKMSKLCQLYKIMNMIVLAVRLEAQKSKIFPKTNQT